MTTACDDHHRGECRTRGGRSTFGALVAALLFAAGCRTGGPAAGDPGVPLFRGMGSHHPAISTVSKEAQRYFDQGLVFAYAFNHDEAIRSFEEAARLDPDCAMCWWGVALCHGPHINNPVMSAARGASAWEALQKAIQRKTQATPTEQALIDALAHRYANPPPTDRGPLDAAYADAMRSVREANPTDADIAMLYAEALMDLQPWDLWTREGTPKGRTEEIVATIEAALRLNPKHPGALHLQIHALEASSNPSRAIPAADRLRRLVPAAGHLVHMPSHIDVLTGRWTEAVEANQRAIEADRRYRQISPHQEFLHVYMAHNLQMLAFAAMMEGRGQIAVQAAREILPSVPTEFVRGAAAGLDPYFTIRYDALVRFGRWDQILAEPPPPDYLPVTTAVWKFARTVAFAAQGHLPEAGSAHAEFKAARAAIPPDRMLAINPAQNVLAIADHVIAGEIAFRRKRIDEAVGQLSQAIALEDQLAYMEPPEWSQPVRHTLGAVLVHAGRHAEAEKVYRADLVKWPENGWSLFGLAKCLRARGASAEAAQVERRFKKAWAHADISLDSTCLCVRGPVPGR